MTDELQDGNNDPEWKKRDDKRSEFIKKNFDGEPIEREKPKLIIELDSKTWKRDKGKSDS